jgi:hypothetical protein
MMRFMVRTTPFTCGSQASVTSMIRMEAPLRRPGWPVG